MMMSQKENTKLLYKTAVTLSAGAVASFITQPLEVFKTNMINSPTLYMSELHKMIIKDGWKQYMRGGSIAIVRQSYGFAIYTKTIKQTNKLIDRWNPGFNKIYKYSIAAVVGKFTAMFFQAPLTLLKTRREVVSSMTLRQQIRYFFQSPLTQLTRGLGTTLARQSIYSIFQYNTYRYLKDDIFNNKLGIQITFLPAFLAGYFAITVSQPFEVIRSKISISKISVSSFQCLRIQLQSQGWRGLFTGYIPRLLRKPINSGVSWTILQTIKPDDNVY